jgi:hypothetical protein
MIAPNGRRSPSAPKPTRFLSQRFQRVAGEKAPPGLRGQYAVVRQGREVLGLVAVDGELGIWYTPRAEDQAELRRQGFRYSHHDLLAHLYFDLLAAGAPRWAAATHPPAVAAPLQWAARATPASPAPAARLEEPTLAGAAAGRSR